MCSVTSLTVIIGDANWVQKDDHFRVGLANVYLCHSNKSESVHEVVWGTEGEQKPDEEARVNCHSLRRSLQQRAEQTPQYHACISSH